MTHFEIEPGPRCLNVHALEGVGRWYPGRGEYGHNSWDGSTRHGDDFQGLLVQEAPDEYAAVTIPRYVPGSGVFSPHPESIDSPTR